jgi:hypothetical protein
MSILVLLTTAVWAAGCGRDRFDPHAQGVAQQRQAKTSAVDAATERLFDGLPIYGSGHRDACESGQDNGWVRDPYRMRCGFAYRGVAGLAAGTAIAAIEEARQHLDRAGCTGTGSTDPQRIGLTAQSGISAALWGGAFMCNGVDLRVVVGRSADAKLAKQIGALLPGPEGTTIEEQNLDAIEAFANASRDARSHVLVADTADDYYVEPR